MKDIEKIETILKAVGIAGSLGEGNRRVDIGSSAFEIEKIPNDLNAIRELELLVIEKVGRFEYGQALMNAMSVSLYVPIATIATADASTRIAAMLAALEGDK